jgi:hypothetical protein
VTVLLDGDEPGRTGARNLVERLGNAGVEVVEIKMLREGLQPDTVKPDTLRVCLGITPKVERPIEITDDAIPHLTA